MQMSLKASALPSEEASEKPLQQSYALPKCLDNLDVNTTIHIEPATLYKYKHRVTAVHVEAGFP